ncbi:TIGR01459 family HAD-type hydrolase [Meridianimarinicoccus aquatilis]|uniref:TIGR01459 family HAD-type hydrolase n=1 Tax=Meridianimarinicoccus aquatilis TaxID=2552766 RepID=A0A4R6B396_9RHOB|nr:TIGR01459 family HAD-type hydrolase [Fluviibacterium aquatile]QIE41095.1 TIGR01459 family HAD-type hydrolase [Rhodobacteraceae bacterium SC52]TDL89396.1 TIGR01459 family HAD-type hydrolase [Fluviibacterium aquatile]
MTRIIDSLSDISASYDAVFCDLWGCLHNGVNVFDSAVAALQAFRASGGKVILVTNSPRPRDQVAAQLDGLGAPRDCWDDIATSGDSAQAAMVHGIVGQKVFHLGPERDMSFFTDLAEDLPTPEFTLVPLDEADGIVCTGLLDDTTETPDDYRGQLLLAKTKGLKMLCANPDIIVDKGDSRIYCAGALAQLYTEMGGESLYFGKPHPPIYDLARRRLSALAKVSDDRILAIGDGPGTDLAGAMGEDIDFLFVTGGIVAEQTGTDRQPDPDKLKAFLQQERLATTFSVGHLR